MTDRENKDGLGGKEMDDGISPAGPSQDEKFYEIQIKGQLNNRWSEWLEGLEVKLLENGEMILYGPIIDQAALMGVLNKLNRLNLALISINEGTPKNEKNR
jgi:hypothetical protein